LFRDIATITPTTIPEGTYQANLLVVIPKIIPNNNPITPDNVQSAADTKPAGTAPIAVIPP